MRFQSIRYLLNLLVEYNVVQTIGVAERGGGVGDIIQNW